MHSILWVLTIGVAVFEITFSIVLAYHWFRFANRGAAIVTLVVHSTVALILLALLFAFGAHLAL